MWGNILGMTAVIALCAIAAVAATAVLITLFNASGIPMAQSFVLGAAITALVGCLISARVAMWLRDRKPEPTGYPQ